MTPYRIQGGLQHLIVVASLVVSQMQPGRDATAGETHPRISVKAATYTGGGYVHRYIAIFRLYKDGCALGFLGNPRIGRRLKRRRATVVLKSFEGTTKEPEHDEDGGWILEQIEIHTSMQFIGAIETFLVGRMRGDGRTESRVTQIFRDRVSEKRSLPIFAQQ